jgi:membrane protein
MNKLQKITIRLDDFQQKHAFLAFPAAVIKRYGEDKIGKQAALITYYGFLALFPLILAFIAIIGIVVQNDPELQAKIYAQVFQYFPALGHDLAGSFHSLKHQGLPLIIELLVLVYGARGVAATLQESFNYVWHADKDLHSNYFLDTLRHFAMIVAVGVGVTFSTIITYWLVSILKVNLSTTVFVTLVNLVLSFCLFLLVFRLGTTNRVKTKSLMFGAVFAGIGLLIIQHFGAYIMGHELPKLRGAYGSFALTLGIMFWIYLQAQIIMYALVITAVRTQRDWPRKVLS